MGRFTIGVDRVDTPVFNWATAGWNRCADPPRPWNGWGVPFAGFDFFLEFTSTFVLSLIAQTSIVCVASWLR